MTVRRLIAVLVVSCALAAAAAIAVVRHAPPVDPRMPARLETWSHQGYAVDVPPNSLGSVAAAIDAGAGGVELDVHFDASRARFLVSRTRNPYQTPDGRLLDLQDVLARFGNETKFWIDLKNLDRANCDAVASRLGSLAEALGLTERIYVESTRGWALRRLRAAGLKTIYTIDLKPGHWSHVPRIVAATAVVAVTDHTAIGVPYDAMDGTFMFLFGRRPLFVFTVNDPAALAELGRLSSVRVVLSDGPFAAAPGASRPIRGG